MPDPDVLIVGAGPAGSIAALVLARAGARVRLLDRATFPRDKLCGDTINPGTLALLRRLNLATPIEAGTLRVGGMIVSGPRGVVIRGTYPAGRYGLALTRRELDWALLQAAVKAGAAFEPSVTVRGATVTDASGTPLVEGVQVESNGATRSIRARVTIAADGRRSTLAFALGLARHPVSPRRWAVGAYVESATPPGSLGEMHIRRGRYIGIAPVGGGLTNICLVRPLSPGDLRDPELVLRREVAADALIGARFANARLAGPPAVLGPLAVDVSGRAIDGLLMAGDAAGFVDPMTGDGLRFAIRGGELAAAAALEALERQAAAVLEQLQRRRAAAVALGAIGTAGLAKRCGVQCSLPQGALRCASLWTS
jgi:flavin-dependent dehydrogenase